MKSEFLIAVTQLAAERNLPRQKIISAIEAALASAYRKDNQGTSLNVSVQFNPSNGEMRFFALKDVAEQVEDPEKQIALPDARRYNASAALGQTVPIEMEPHLGRIGAQTAKQVVMQRLREAERELVYEEYSHRAGEVVSGVVQRLEGRDVIVDLGRAEALLPPNEQVPSERYRPGLRLKAYIVDVHRTVRGPEIVVSRTHRELLRRLFELEIPEIQNGVVEIRGVAREPGSRSKIGVAARQEGVDPVGSCVGLRGIRIQNIVNELHNEKIDVVPWSRNPITFVNSALSPAQVMRAEVDEEEGAVKVVVPDRQLSLAIGREGQNARLASRLTGWRIDIKSTSQYEAERLHGPGAEPPPQAAAAPAEAAPATTEEPAAAITPEEPVEPVPAVEERPAEPVAAQEPAAETPPAEEERPSYERILEEVEELPGHQEEQEAPRAEEGVIEAEEEEEATEEEGEEEEEEEEDIWSISRIAEEAPAASGIRFAEDIMPEWGQGKGGRGRRRGSGRGGAQGKKQARPKARTGGGQRGPGRKAGS